MFDLRTSLLGDLAAARRGDAASAAWWLDTRPLSDAEIDWFAREGVTLDALFAPPAPNAARVAFSRRRFAFAGEAGEAAIVFRAEGAPGRGRLLDLVAWQPRTGALAALLRRAPLLGEARLYGGGGDGLAVFASPLGWLRAGRRGVVPVARREAAAMLAFQEALVFDDVAFAETMRAAMRPRLPKMLVREEAVAA